MSIGSFIQHERQGQKISVQGMAAETGLSIGTIRAVEQGRRIPSAKALHKILTFLRIDLEENWIDPVTWRNPITGETHYLVASPGGHRNHKKKQYPDPSLMSHGVGLSSDEIEALRLSLISTIIAADSRRLEAVRDLLAI